MIPMLQDFTASQHENDISFLDSRKAMRDGNHRAALLACCTLNGFLDEFLRLTI
jgi:hypothetical protein